MYRAVTLYSIDKNIAIKNIPNHFEQIDLCFKHIDGKCIIFLDNIDVSLKIRSKEVNDSVSLVAKMSSVRKFLVEKQKALGQNKGIVMDGRDIGTVVFPDAEVKFFIEADIDVRTIRRATEMAEIGRSLPSEVIKKNLLERDRIDSTRADSPLKKADDAITIDNSNLSKKEQLDLCLKYIAAIVEK